MFLLRRFPTGSDVSLQGCKITRIVNPCLNTFPGDCAQEVSLVVGECVMTALNIANLIQWPVDGCPVVGPFGVPVEA